MNKSQITKWAVRTSLLLILGFPVWMEMLRSHPFLMIPYFAASGPICGATALLLAVQWVNRRDDDRLAKRPPDPP